MKHLLFAAAIVLPHAVFAVGTDDSAPTSSETTTECSDGQIWDSATSSCVTPKDSRLDDDTLYQAAREFAYAGQFEHAQEALAEISAQSSDRVLTYWGFTHRKLGDHDLGMTYYRKALEINPNNTRARSYMGQALVLIGDDVGAYVQLLEIRARGGENTWAETALEQALSQGKDFSY